MPDTHLPLHLAPTAIEQLFPTLTGAQMARITWLYVASGDSVLVVAVMHSVLNALGDTFTSSRYIPDADPLVMSGGGLVGTGILLVGVGAWTWLRRERV